MWQFLFEGVQGSAEYLKDPATVKQAVVSIATYVGAFILAALATHSRQKLKKMGEARARRREEANRPPPSKPWSELARAIFHSLHSPALTLLTDSSGKVHGFELAGRLGVVFHPMPGFDSECGEERPLFMVGGKAVNNELEEGELAACVSRAQRKFDQLSESLRMENHKKLVRLLDPLKGGGEYMDDPVGKDHVGDGEQMKADPSVGTVGFSPPRTHICNL